jgi:pyridoxine 4-dehydrogenase
MRITGREIWANPPTGHLRKACEDSLRRLRLEQIPLHQLHKPDPKVPFAESAGALAELRAAGRIRHIGISAVTEAQFRGAAQVTPIASVQNRYNTTDRASQPAPGSSTSYRYRHRPIRLRRSPESRTRATQNV